MIKKFPILFVAAAIAFLSSTAFAQRADMAGLTAGALVKVGAGGIRAEATTGTATSTAAAATINADSGKITTESLTTAGLATYTMTLTNSLITSASKIFVSFEYAGAGSMTLGAVAPGTGSATIKLYNAHATVAFNAISKINFWIVQ